MILVISSPQDTHAEEVLQHLQGLGANARLLDLSLFPNQMQLSVDFDGGSADAAQQLCGAGANVDFAECHVIWWRRPQPFTLHAEVANSIDRAFAYTEGHSAFSGLWLTLDKFWINHPTRDEEAARKVYQLKVAQELGLRIPKTCITNDAKHARRFIDARGPEHTVYKAFAGTEQAWRETRLLKSRELELLESVRFAPVIFQEFIPATADLRITIVGKDIFPAAICVQPTSYQVDFRMAMDDASITATALPEPLCAQLRAYMSRLGLIYGAIDMRLTPAGDYVFLEVNPSGQWLFVEQRTGQPITATLAGLMAREDRKASRSLRQ